MKSSISFITKDVPNKWGDSATLDFVAATIATTLVVLITVFRGSNRHVPLTIFEWLSLALILVLACAALFKANGAASQRLGTGVRRWALILLMFSPLWIAAMQLVPLPIGATWQPLSKLPLATWASTLAGIPIVALFLCGLVCEERSLAWLVRAWVAVAVFQASLGLLQLGGFEWLGFGSEGPVVVVGTFGNRNHFASFLAMSIPLAMLGVKTFAPETSRFRGLSWPAVAMLFVLMAALFASLSRAGLVLGLMAATATGWVLWRPLQQARQGGAAWLWVLIPLLALLVLAVGGLEWLSRFDISRLEVSAQVRELNRLSAWEAAMEYWPWGSGMGTLPGVFAQYQAPEIHQFVDYAHNDYVQWLLELGMIFPVEALNVLLLIGARAVQLTKSSRSRSSTQDRLALVSAMGLIAVSLHAWVDFPLRIPANAMLAAFLLGVFLREPTPRATGSSSSGQTP